MATDQSPADITGINTTPVTSDTITVPDKALIGGSVTFSRSSGSGDMTVTPQVAYVASSPGASDWTDLQSFTVPASEDGNPQDIPFDAVAPFQRVKIVCSASDGVDATFNVISRTF
jgi:hypothetical protein